MKQIQKTLIVPFTAEQVFSVVSDIPRYSEFLPYCHQAGILSRTGSEVQGEICVGYKQLTYRLVTRNQEKPFKIIAMNLEEGPFRALQGEWKFESMQENSTQVTLGLQYRMQNPLLAFTLDRMMQPLVDKVMESFTLRMKVLYG